MIGFLCVAHSQSRRAGEDTHILHPGGGGIHLSSDIFLWGGPLPFLGGGRKKNFFVREESVSPIPPLLGGKNYFWGG